MLQYQNGPVSNAILHAVDSIQALFLVLLDLSSAFNTVDHLLLVKHFKSCGVEGIALEWLSSYLADRSQSVKISESTSSPAALNFGVPQGSVLGPLLFSIYFSLVANIASQHCLQIHLYADDTQLYIPFDPSDTVSDFSAKHQLETCIADIGA